MADLAGPVTTSLARSTTADVTDPFKFNQLQVSGSVSLDEALDYAK